MPEKSPKDILKNFSTGRILLPVLIGLGVTAFLLFKDAGTKQFGKLEWTSQSLGWLLAALLMLVVRDFSYVVRIRALTDNQVGWYRGFIVIMLWEFASALAPGMIGGGFFFAIFILNREGVNMGKSITAIMLSSFLDGIFLALMAPFVYFVAGKESLFSSSVSLESFFGNGIFYSFWIVYFIILAYKVFVAYALFVNPRFVKWLLLKIFSVRFLKRWRPGVRETGNQLIIASKGLRHKTKKFWINSIGATFASWTARYAIANFLILAFHPAVVDNFVIFGRQVVMGLLVLFSPTPGGSGIAEYMFSHFLGDYTTAPDILGFLWRTFSYYPYLLIGVIILPRWLRKHFSKKELVAIDVIK